MTKRLISLLLLTLFIGSCAPATTSPTLTPTATLYPTRTPRPTQTPIPTATPYPPLQTEGPYLLFTYDNKNFTIMDADGSGRKQFQLPSDGYTVEYRFENMISPDGKWLAYFTGSTEEPYDLALNLFNISNETSQLISNLIAPGFPENLEPVTEIIRFTEYDIECSKDPACRSRIVQLDFRTGIWSLGWSPDNQQLAFAAQIDGSSSDVYVFNIEGNSIHRLTNEPENIGLLVEWSPNKEKILYTTSIPQTSYYSHYLHIADLKIKLPQNPRILDGGAFWGRKRLYRRESVSPLGCF